MQQVARRKRHKLKRTLIELSLRLTLSFFKFMTLAAIFMNIHQTFYLFPTFPS